jgi:putative methyltransferase (TIGR04325 family)
MTKARFKQIALRVLPPVLVDALSNVASRLSRKPPEWEHVPKERFSDSSSMDGWNVESVLAEQLRKWDELLALTSGTGPLGIDPHASPLTNSDYRAHNNLMTFGYVLALAALRQSPLSILDWGSGPGQYYLFARALLPEVPIDYHAFDVPLLSEGGRQKVPQATFHDDEDSAFSRTYGLVMASGSLQYVLDWRTTLKKLATAAAAHLYVVVPTVRHNETFVIVQRPHRYGYDTELTQWVFNRDELIGEVERSGLELRRVFLNEEMGPIKGTPERRATAGFLFERRLESSAR